MSFVCVGLRQYCSRSDVVTHKVMYAPIFNGCYALPLTFQNSEVVTNEMLETNQSFR